MKTLVRVAIITSGVLTALWASGCASGTERTDPPEPPQDAAEGDSGASDGTLAPATTRRTFDVAENGRTAVALTMCAQVGYDTAFGLDWCELDGDDIIITEMVQSSCDLFDSIDPMWSMTDDQIIEEYTNMSMILVMNGDATFEEATTMATLNGAVAGLRDDLCG